MGLIENEKSSGRGCQEYQCEKLIAESRNIKDLPPAETKGIFVIKENDTIIYVGKSDDCMRERMLSHLAGYDAQSVGKYMKSLSKDYKDSNIRVNWVEIRNPKCQDHHYVKCLAERQREWPKHNLQRGRPRKYPE